MYININHKIYNFVKFGLNNSFVVLVIFLGQFLHLISVNNVLFWIIYIIFPYVQILKDLLKVQN